MFRLATEGGYLLDPRAANHDERILNENRYHYKPLRMKLHL